MCNVQADGIRFKVVAGVHWAAAIRHIASVPEDRQLLEERDQLWDCSWPNDQVSHQHLAPYAHCTVAEQVISPWCIIK